jgi:hypothetical protein
VYLSSFWLGLILIMPASVAVLRTSAGVMDARTVVFCTVVHVKMREEYDDVHAHRQIFSVRCPTLIYTDEVPHG